MSASPLRSLCLVALLASTMPPMSSGRSADAYGAFMMGGGAGGTSCATFLGRMGAARQKGGLTSIAGISEIDGYVMFVLGFQTGFNSEAKGVYDVFEAFAPDPGTQALSAIEPWCAANPGATFSQAVLELASKLRRQR